MTLRQRSFVRPGCWWSNLYTSQVMKSETMRLQHEQNVMKEKIRDNGEKIKQNKVLPYLVGNVVEVRICVRFCNPYFTLTVLPHRF